MFYKVVAKCGHIGNRKYIDVPFAVMANSKKEAAQKILTHGKVKKHLKDAITYVLAIDYDEFIELREMNKNDDYIRSHNKRGFSICDYDVLDTKRNKIYKNRTEFLCREEKIKYLLKKRWLENERFFRTKK